MSDAFDCKDVIVFRLIFTGCAEMTTNFILVRIGIEINFVRLLYDDWFLRSLIDRSLRRSVVRGSGRIVSWLGFVDDGGVWRLLLVYLILLRSAGLGEVSAGGSGGAGGASGGRLIVVLGVEVSKQSSAAEAAMLGVGLKILK